MDHLLHQLPVILPLLFWAGYHYKDRHLPEPISRLLLTFAFGVGAFYLGGLMYVALDLVDLRYGAYELGKTNLPGLFAYSILAIGGIEEFAKMARSCCSSSASRTSTSRSTVSSMHHLSHWVSPRWKISSTCMA